VYPEPSALRNEGGDDGTGGVRGRILAIDYGEKRVGLALSDPLRVLAGGAGTISNNANLAGAIKKLIEDKDIRAIVVGLPLAPDGGRGKQALEVEAFVAVLRRQVGVPIMTWDESSTSVDARRTFIEGGMRKKKRREKGRVDEMAARLLLQDYLDSQSSQRSA